MYKKFSYGVSVIISTLRSLSGHVSSRLFVRACIMSITLVLGSVVSGAVAGADAATDKLDQRLVQVKKLLEKSSGAKEIITTGKQEALDLREDALTFYKQALAEKKAGNEEQANTLLNNATNKMFEAIRASSSDAKSAGSTSNLARKWESVNALMSAMQRIQSEKETDETEAIVMSQINTYLNQAKRLEEKGEQQGALVMLAQALDLLKSSIEKMRGGETLVKSLTFTDKSEEYKYELDRNNTHLMLVDVLTKEKKPSKQARKRIAEFIKEARSLRKEAEKISKKGKMQEAIDALEASTKQLVRAIRSAGVYIPG